MSRGSSELPVDLKYRLYESSVQCFEADLAFLNKEYKKLFKRKPLTLREDFGGTGGMACDWVKQSKEHEAYAIDLDPEPINYGKENHFAALSAAEQKRMHYIQGNVLDSYPFKTDIIVAFNFSYFIFKKRADLLHYFKQVRNGLGKDGAFFIDLFGGMECAQPLEEETEHKTHSYFWDCDSFNPITNEVMYYIHFKYKGKKYREVFKYDWRMWGLQELRDILTDAGFSETITYWEEDDEKGGGNGTFYRTKEAENCDSWVTYICAIP